MLALAAGALLQTSKPEFATRWGLHGQPSAYIDARLAVLMLPLVAAAITAMFALAPRVLPAGTLDRSAVAWTAVWTAILLALCAGQASLVALNLGVHVDVPRLAALIVAVTFAFIGNYMGKIRYNYAIGLRTPWTLANERVWDKTHRFLGRAMVAGAAVLAVATFLTPAGRAGDVWMLTEILICALAPPLAAIIYSIRISPPPSHDGAAS
jgi:uncharacterized membrane protein